MKGSTEGQVIEVVAERVGNSWKAICPKHDDTKPSLSISEEKGLFNCFGCDFKGVVVKKRIAVEYYDYEDRKGNLSYQSIRYEPKDFGFRRPDGHGNWIYDLQGVQRVLYKLPELINADKNEPVLIVEGEKDVDNLRSLGFIATTSPMGADNWRKEYNQYFKGRDVVLIPDNDEKGRNYSKTVGANLKNIAKSVRWLELPGLQEKEDVSDWIERGGDVEKLLDFVKNCSKNFSEIDECSLEAEGITIIKEFSARTYTDILIKKFNLKRDKFKRFWIYDNESKIWHEGAGDIIKSELRKHILLEKHLKNHYVGEVISDIEQLLYENKIFEESNPDLIPFADRIYNLKNDEYIDYSPDYFFTNKIPVRINTKNRECNFIDSLFESFVGSENKNSLYELSAYCLYRRYPFQKFFVLIGEGGNGKSTFVRILKKLIGETNISTINFRDITSDRFAASQLFKKFVNISGELDNYTIKNTSMLKQLTGGDYITAQEKFKDLFQFENYAKLIIQTNTLPKPEDATKAYSRRLMIIDFPNEFIAGENAISEIDAQITTDEIEGFAYQCIQCLKELKKRNFVFEQKSDPAEDINQYASEQKILRQFLNEFTDRNLESSISSWEFSQKFKDYQQGINIISWSPNKISKYMNMLGFKKEIKSVKNIEGNWTTQSVWSGFRWKE